MAIFPHIIFRSVSLISLLSLNGLLAPNLAQIQALFKLQKCLNLKYFCQNNWTGNKRFFCSKLAEDWLREGHEWSAMKHHIQAAEAYLRAQSLFKQNGDDNNHSDQQLATKALELAANAYLTFALLLDTSDSQMGPVLFLAGQIFMELFADSRELLKRKNMLCQAIYCFERAKLHSNKTISELSDTNLQQAILFFEKLD